jgi:GAF domain-containing protein
VTEGEFRAAVAAGLAGTEESYRALLRSIVGTARAIFQARASSIFMLDEDADELVFEAIAGEGEEGLLGRRFPSSTGIAGWVLVTRQPLVLEDVASDPRFARELAEGTGYVPRGLMAVPLLHEERALGVLEVLDRQAAFTLADMDLLALFAGQAGIALDLLQRGRRAQALLAGGDDDLAGVARLAAALESTAEGEEREPARALLEALAEVLERK